MCSPPVRQIERNGGRTVGVFYTRAPLRGCRSRRVGVNVKVDTAKSKHVCGEVEEDPFQEILPSSVHRH